MKQAQTSAYDNEFTAISDLNACDNKNEQVEKNALLAPNATFT